MKILSVLLTLFSGLLWWEIPVFCLLFSIVCIAIVIYKKEWTFWYKIVTVISVIVILLCIWNWDLHVGISILEYFDKL